MALPGGHEFTSFVLGLYNAAGPGQAIEPAVKAAVEALDKPVELKILVSCPARCVRSWSRRRSALRRKVPLVSAEVYDLNHFPMLREQYHVMSVPCLVVNDGKVSFGKKNMAQVMDLIRNEQKG